MKIRIRGDSVRLRLKRSEVVQLAAGTGIVEETHFPGAVLTYRLNVAENESISATFDNANLVVSLPKSELLNWVNTDEVSMYTEQELSGSRSLSLLIEKDFKCLEPGHHRDCEDDEDTFPHPGAQSAGA